MVSSVMRSYKCDTPFLLRRSVLGVFIAMGVVYLLRYQQASKVTDGLRYMDFFQDRSKAGSWVNRLTKENPDLV
jgi:hypothetical protein